jgi:hypothetical protein
MPEEEVKSAATNAKTVKKKTAEKPVESTDEPAGFDGPVTVRCIVKTEPWTDKKALAHGEEAEVPADVAEAMLKNKQVELV